MWYSLVLFVGGAASVAAAYADPPYDNYVGAGGGGGYYGYGAAPGPFPAFPNFDFGQLLFNYLNNLQKYNQDLVSSIQANVERLGQQGAYAGGFGGSYGGGSSATASIGGGQAHQTASVYPENPGVPNVDTRFATASAPGGGGFYGVFTSSQSGTKLVDGKPVTYQKAQTTVNDNGKISTRVVSNP